MMNEETYLTCECGSDEHTLRFSVDVSTSRNELFNGCVELYTSVFLNQYRSFGHKLWVGIKYVCGYKSRYGH